MQEICIETPFFPRLMQGISQACNNHDYILSLLLLNSQEEAVRLFPKISQKRPFDGIVVAAIRSGDPLVSKLLDNKVPVVLHGKHDDSRVKALKTLVQRSVNTPTNWTVKEKLICY